MELVGVYKNDNHETCSKYNEMGLDRDGDTHANKDQKLSYTEARARSHRGLSVGNKCVLLSSVCFGLMCIFLVAAIVVLHIKLMAEKEVQATHMLQSSSRDQTEKEQLQNNFNSLSQKKLELETRVKDVTAEKDQLQGSLSSLSQKKLELETRVKDLTAEKDQLQGNFSSLRQKILELETEITKLSEQASGICLFTSTELKSWSDSRQYCRDRGADLVIINTEEKQRFLSSFVKERAWIGLSDTEQEGSMTWVDNSPLKQGFWFSGEPNDADGNEDCIEIKPGNPILNNWNDLPCSEKRKGICEKFHP